MSINLAEATDTKTQTCCFTGHRKIPMLDRMRISRQLDTTIQKLVDEGICYFGAGGALGFDTMAAQAVLRARRRNPQIKLILVLPCRTQTLGWKESDVATYEAIKKAADKYKYISDEYTRSCMFERNRHLVDNSFVCVAYLTESSGGTAYTVNYAKQKGVRVINLAEKTMATKELL